MLYDVSLPLYLLSISLLSALLFIKYGKKFESMLGKREIKHSETTLLVLFMGLIITLIVFIPNLAVTALILAANFFLHTIFFYILIENRFLATFFPLLFLISYFIFWNDLMLDLFASLSVLSLSLLSGIVFTWKTTILFTVLLTLLDVFHVFVTRFMVVSGEKLIALNLPVVVSIPLFPLEGKIFLGLGDIFLTCLLTIQAYRRFSFKAGIISATIISLVFLLGESLLLTFRVEFFPATTIIFSGWALFTTLNYATSIKEVKS